MLHPKGLLLNVADYSRSGSGGLLLGGGATYSFVQPSVYAASGGLLLGGGGAYSFQEPKFYNYVAPVEPSGLSVYLRAGATPQNDVLLRDPLKSTSGLLLGGAGVTDPSDFWLTLTWDVRVKYQLDLPLTWRVRRATYFLDLPLTWTVIGAIGGSTLPLRWRVIPDVITPFNNDIQQPVTKAALFGQGAFYIDEFIPSTSPPPMGPDSSYQFISVGFIPRTQP